MKRTIGTQNDGVIDVDSIVAMGISEDKENSVFKIVFICMDGNKHVFAEYPTLEKAERYFYDLAIKFEYLRRPLNCPYLASARNLGGD